MHHLEPVAEEDGALPALLHVLDGHEPAMLQALVARGTLAETRQVVV